MLCLCTCFSPTTTVFGGVVHYWLLWPALPPLPRLGVSPSRVSLSVWISLLLETGDSDLLLEAEERSPKSVSCVLSGIDVGVKGKVDPLLGLKENVIIGKLIPAGTGMNRYRSILLKKPNSVQAEAL